MQQTFGCINILPRHFYPLLLQNKFLLFFSCNKIIRNQNGAWSTTPFVLNGSKNNQSTGLFFDCSKNNQRLWLFFDFSKNNQRLWLLFDCTLYNQITIKYFDTVYSTLIVLWTIFYFDCSLNNQSARS